MNDRPGEIDHDAADSQEGELIGKPIREDQAAAARANPITYIEDDTPPS